MTLKDRAAFMWSQVGQAPSAMVPWFLMLSWLYYKHDISLVPDEDFDRLCKALQERWDAIEHPHKDFISQDDLKAGTGYAIRDYPSITEGAASRLAIEDKHVKWNKKARRWLKA
jgi:hypothetical protein